MEKKLEVSYVYDPAKKTLECDAIYDGLIKDSFCVMFDGCLTCKTVHEFVSGFVQYLKEKENGNKVPVLWNCKGQNE